MNPVSNQNDTRYKLKKMSNKWMMGVAFRQQARSLHLHFLTFKSRKVWHFFLPFINDTIFLLKEPKSIWTFNLRVSMNLKKLFLSPIELLQLYCFMHQGVSECDMERGNANGQTHVWFCQWHWHCWDCHPLDRLLHETPPFF